MTSPMPELPVHCPIRVDEFGNGPVPEDWPGSHTECWCGDPDCDRR